MSQTDATGSKVSRFWITGITPSFSSFRWINRRIHQPEVCPGSIHIKCAICHTLGLKSFQLLMTPGSNTMVPRNLPSPEPLNKFLGIRRAICFVVHIERRINTGRIFFISD
ncbi:MAG TPA: hypothetical protein EYG52_06455 [Pseudomonadales bacterium]|nr:hypothetical protein [Gammaproteobacteria bacterium]HIL83134.1 hypothetical protein [Pseudomonadales bacterium]